METNLNKTKLSIKRNSASPLNFNYIEFPICNFRITPCRLCFSNLVIFYRNSRRVFLAIVASKRYWTVFFFFGVGGGGGRISTWNNCAKKNWVKKELMHINYGKTLKKDIPLWPFFLTNLTCLRNACRKGKFDSKKCFSLFASVPWIEVGLRSVNN